MPSEDRGTFEYCVETLNIRFFVDEVGVRKPEKSARTSLTLNFLTPDNRRPAREMTFFYIYPLLTALWRNHPIKIQGDILAANR